MRSFSNPLPIDSVLDQVLDTLSINMNALLVAEPGAGKTTRIPLAMLDAPWRRNGRIIVLEPRRLAARAAAQHMARELGEKVGQTVGYRIRMDSQVSSKTCIEVVTEGVFTRMILDDPELSGVSAVLFDEFHERSLEGDLGLALALDVQSAFRGDLRIMPMSATIDTKTISSFLGDCPVIKSSGRSFPVQTEYLGRRPSETIERSMASAIQKALHEEQGSILAFLPGQSEIKRTASLLQDKLPANCLLAPLYGSMDGKTQDIAIKPVQDGLRKIVLATSIAQTSLTIEGVRVVIDSGLARVPKYEPQTGLTRLETVRVSQASANQRRGRAGRTQPGVCYRMWDEMQTSALPANEAPGILEADLSSLALDLASWGTLDPAQLSFLDMPPPGAWAEALSLLRSLHALDNTGRLTQSGKRLSRLPLPPRLAHMIIKGSQYDAGTTAVRLAALLADPGLGGKDPDLRLRLKVFQADTSKRSKDSASMAQAWLKLTGGKPSPSNPEDIGWLLALAYPERIAQARGRLGQFRLANGRGAELPDEYPLAREPFLVVADIQGRAANGRIRLCAPIERQHIEAHFSNDIVDEDEIQIVKDGTVKARRVRRYKRLELESEQISKPNQLAVENALITELSRQGAARLPWTGKQLRLRARASYLIANGHKNIPDLSDKTLTATLPDWLGPYIAGCTALSAIDSHKLDNALSALLTYEMNALLDRLAPSHFQAPTGTKVPIDYGTAAGPSASIRVQELYGLTIHPTVCSGKVPLILELLSPAQRPIQITQDLPGFWAGSWSDVKADMKGRYPKHFWPEDPASAEPTRHAKPRK